MVYQNLRSRPSRSLPAALLLVVLVWHGQLEAWASQAAPSNDDFANRIVLAGATVSTTGSNLNATAEAGEPDPAAVSGAASVWWRWTAPASGSVTIDTAGSAYDTTLGVYTGSSVTALTLVADNDDAIGVQSQVGFVATAGTEYQIQVNGYLGSSGSIGLNIAPGPTPPPNDDFADRIALSGTVVSTTGTNQGATGEAGEPDPAGSSGTTSVWWRWTAPASGSVTIDTAGSAYDTTLGVYTGSSVTALTLVADNDDAIGVQSQVGFVATAGTEYQIQVNGYLGSSGSIGLNIAPGPTPPPNDDFANRIVLSGTVAITTGSNQLGTAEFGEPSPTVFSGTTSVWWTWTAPVSDTTTINTFGSDYDTTLGVYTGSSVTALTLVAANDDTLGPQSQVVFAATAGTVYQIQVNGYFGASGNIALLIAEGPPPNDDFANSIVLAGSTVSTTGSNVNATAEAGEPDPAAVSGAASVWWTWTAPGSGTVTIDTMGSNYDTTLGVYTGSTVTGLTLVAANNDTTGAQSEVVFVATAGTVYHIQVNGSGGAVGTIALYVSIPSIPLKGEHQVGLCGSLGVDLLIPVALLWMSRRIRRKLW